MPGLPAKSRRRCRSLRLCFPKVWKSRRGPLRPFQDCGHRLLAAFGHVSASEDDAERAVRAGLALTVLRLASARRSPPCPVRTGSADSRDRTRRRERRHDRAVTSFAAHLPAGARGARRCRRAGRGRVAGARPRGADVAGPPHRRCDVARTLPCTARRFAGRDAGLVRRERRPMKFAQLIVCAVLGP